MKIDKKIILIGLFSLIIPIILNFLFVIFTKIAEGNLNFLFAKGLNNSNWLSFYAGYMPALVTLISIIVLIKNNQELLENQTKENNKILEFQKIEIEYRNRKEDLEKLKNIFVETLIAFDTEIFFKFITTISTNTSKEYKQIFIETQEKLVKAKKKIEFLSDITISFEMCNCEKKTCEKREKVEKLQKIYYDNMEIYWNLIVTFITKIIPKKEILEIKREIHNNIIREKILLEDLLKRNPNLKTEELREVKNKEKVILEELNKLNIEIEKLFEVEKINAFREKNMPELQGKFKEYLLYKEKEIDDFFNNRFKELECKYGRF